MVFNKRQINKLKINWVVAVQMKLVWFLFQQFCFFFSLSLIWKYVIRNIIWHFGVSTFSPIFETFRKCVHWTRLNHDHTTTLRLLNICNSASCSWQFDICFNSNGRIEITDLNVNRTLRDRNGLLPFILAVIS